MKTIQERADAYVGHPREIEEDLSIGISRNAYIQGAKEQRKIDIERACDILTQLGVFEWLASDPEEGFDADVYKAQFINCMKEE